MQSKLGGRQLAVLILVLLATTLLFQSTPVSAQEQLNASVSVDKSVIRDGEQITITYKITNEGSETFWGEMYLLFPESRDLLKSWEIVERQDAGASQFDGPGAWFQKPGWAWEYTIIDEGLQAGETIRPSLTLRPPSNTAPDNRQLKAEFTWKGEFAEDVEQLEYQSSGQEILTQSISVRQANTPPTPDFDIEPNNPKVGEGVTFDASSSNDDVGRIVQYNWDIAGDEDFESAGKRVQHTFQEPGSQAVRLQVVDDRGVTRVEKKRIDVQRNNPPSVTVSVPGQTREQQRTSFQITSIDDSEEVGSIEWDFDDDGRIDATTRQASFSYPEPGNYTVKVAVTDELGQSTVRKQQLTVVPNKPPNARFQYDPRNPKALDKVRFEADPTQDDGSLSTFKWDFDNDGTVDKQGRTVAHTFEANGTFTVNLTVVDDLGATGTTERTVQISPNPPPEGRIDLSPTPIATGTEVTLNGKRSTDDGSIAAYRWDLDNDDIADKEGQSIKTQFRTPGTKSVSLTAIDEKGARSERNITFYVHARPTANLEFEPSNPHTNDEIVFDASSSSHPNGTIVEYKWDLNGDGEFDRRGQNPTYTFNEPGKYNVQLLVTGDAGISSEQTATISVSPEPICDSTCRMGVLIVVALLAAAVVLVSVLGIFDSDRERRWWNDR